MTKKKKALIVLPWVLLLVMCGLEVRSRWKDWELKRDLRKHGNIEGMIEDVRYLGDWGPFQVSAFSTSFDGERTVQVLAHGEVIFSLTSDTWKNDGNIDFSIVRRGPYGFETILRCGTRNGGEGEFPHYVGMTPQNGPDAHKIWVGDYDMDGVFEVRRKALGIDEPTTNDDQDE